MKHILIFASLFLCACTTPKPYENTIHPDGDWHPVNPEHFNKTEAQRIYEGKIKL